MVPAVRALPPGHWRLVVAAMVGGAAGALPATLPAQHATAAVSATAGATVGATVVAGLGLASPLIVDGNGTTVRLAPAPTVGLRLTRAGWRVGPLTGGMVARLSTASLRLRDGGERWTAGRAWQGDLLAGASVSWPDERVTLTAAAGATWLRADRRTSPLRRASLAPAAEATIIVRPAASPWGVALTGQGYRLRPRDGRGGGVARLLAGVARAF